MQKTFPNLLRLQESQLTGRPGSVLDGDRCEPGMTSTAVDNVGFAGFA